jgi:hypothetical protein
MDGKPWYISINAPFAGFAPAYWENTYASFGNRNQARAMTNIDMTDPTGFKQGPGLLTLTNATEAGVLGTLLKHILPVPPIADVTFGIGGDKLHKIPPTSVTSDATWPHTIDKAVVTGEDGESSFVLNSALYYLYNHSGSAGDIGKYDLSATFDDDWGSTVPTGMSALQNAPHPSVVGNDNVAYFGNGRYVGYVDADTNTISADDLDLPVGSQVVDVRYKDSRVWAAVNSPNLAGSNNTVGIIYVWGGVGVPSWDDGPNPRINGKIGAIFPFKGTMFVWFQEVGFTGGYKLGYVRGNEITEVASYSGTMPNFAQVFEYKGMLAWQTNGLLNLWGAPHISVPVALSQLADLGYTTVGAVCSPFGTVMAASNQSSSYKLAKFSGLDVNALWKSIMYTVGPSMVKKVKVTFAPPSTGARVDVKLTRDQGLETLTLTKEGATGSITAALDANRCYKMFSPNLEVQDEFSVEADYANGSAVNPLLIRRIEVWGHTLDKD